MDPNIKLAAVAALENDLGSPNAEIFGRVEDIIKISLGKEAGTTEERQTELDTTLELSVPC